jgi:sterol 24-C-methyltransferase
VRKNGQSLKHSLVQHETHLADKLQLRVGEQCLDLGCGVGGPMINIAKRTGASITGINISTYQVEKGRHFVEEEELQKQCTFLDCDWTRIPRASQTFDKAYTIEATCHAEDRAKVFAEVFRLLKPGGLFAGYEWVMTPRFNPDNERHRYIKHMIEVGDGVPNLKPVADVTESLRLAGFEILECGDLAPQCDPQTPWYLPLKGTRYSLTALRTGPLGRFVLHQCVKVMEALGILPKGSSKVHEVLNTAARGLVKGGEEGIFTPMLFFLARKRA